MKSSLPLIVLLLLPPVAQLCESPSAAADESIDQLASQMTRIPGRSPERSIAATELTEGFQLQLVAAEPHVRDPVAIDFDESGRMYVCELPQYNGYAVEGFQGRGSVRMLEDTDGDGRCDKATVYADNLDYPTGVACWDGGLFIGVAPDLIYVKDTDGDGVADTRQVILTGFEKDKAGESHLNSFRWGFDNRLHISTNLAGGTISIPGNPDFQPLQSRGRGIVLDPRDLTRFELTSGGGQHGMSMDNMGRKYVCSNSVPAQVLMYDDRYLARNPRVRAAAPATDIAPDRKFTRLFRVSPDEPWRRLRTRLRKDGKFRGSDEGGKPFGFFTGATGVTIYRGDAWPKEYRGNLLVGDVANNLIYRATLDSSALQPVARRADSNREFVASRDIWFRPVQMANAPDGTLYVLDIYRELIEGAAFLPPEFLKFLDPVGGNDRGRIYRIAPDDFQTRGNLNLGELSSSELVKLLDHPNGWHRDTASRLLYQRQDITVAGELRTLAQTGQSAEGRMTALYSLDGIGRLQQADIVAALNDGAPLVRLHALRLAENFAAVSPVVVAAMADRTADADLHVRYQLAFSLGAVSTPVTTASLARLVRADGQDPWFRLAVYSSLGTGAGRVFTQLASETQFRNSKYGADFLVELAQQIGASGRQPDMAAVLASLQQIPAEEQELSRRLVESLVADRQGADRERMLSASSGRAGQILAGLIKEAMTVAADRDRPVSERVEAVSSLRLAKAADVRGMLEQLLSLREPGEIQSAAVQTLGEFSDPVAADILLKQWNAFTPAVRAEAAEVLLSRAGWAARLLKAIEDGNLSRSTLDPARVELLKRHPDPATAKAARRIFTASGVSQRAGVVKDYQAALTEQGDAVRGKSIFKKNCSVCHRLEGVGTAVGADLKAVRNRGLSSVLLNILDPNREVKPQFQTYVVLLESGKSVTGMILSESANSMVVRRPDGTSVELHRSEIEELSGTGLSFMPEGLEKQIDVTGMADLLAYLDSIR